MISEYYCTELKEKEFLIANGINYSFVKTIIDTKKTTVWKFKKSKFLFELLMQYYSNK